MLENVELVYQAADAFNLGPLSLPRALRPQRGVHLAARAAAGRQARRGHDGVRSWWEALHRAYRDLSVEIDDVRDLGEVTVARVRLRGRGEARAADAMARHVVAPQEGNPVARFPERGRSRSGRRALE